MTDQGGDDEIRRPAVTLEELAARMREPLKTDDIRTRNGQEYVSGGDVVYLMWSDFGPFGWWWEVQRLEWTPAREEWVDEVDAKGRPKIDKSTGAVEQRVGYSSCAVCVVRVSMRLPDGRVVARDGVGSSASLMQPRPEEAVARAVKAAETDAIKRALYCNGPRYGLALRFKDRDEREELGLIEANEALRKARERRQQNTKGAIPPGAPAGAATATQSSAPAASTDSTAAAHADGDLRRAITHALFCVKDETIKARVVKALAAAKDLQRLQAILAGVKEHLAREAAITGKPAADPSASQGQANSAATSPATSSASQAPATAAPDAQDTSTGASAQASAAPAEASEPKGGSSASSACSSDSKPSDSSLAAGFGTHDQRVTLDKNPAAVTPTLDPPTPAREPGEPPSPAGSSTTLSPPTASSAPTNSQQKPLPQVAGHGTVYGAKADEVAGEKGADTPRTLAWKLVVCEPDAHVGTHLAAGITPGNAPPFGMVIPVDPGYDGLKKAGWEAPGAPAEALAKLGEADPVPSNVVSAVTAHAMALLGKRERLAWLWTQLGCPKRDEGLPNGYQVRLLAWAAAMQHRRDEAAKLDRELAQAVRE